MHEAILRQVSGADDERVMRAMSALESGDMEVNIRHNAGGVLTAEVTSTVVLGKKKPVVKTTVYVVLVSGSTYQCSCPDHEYRGTICKHILAAVMAAQMAEEQQRDVA